MKTSENKKVDRYHKQCLLCNQVIANSQWAKHQKEHQQQPLKFQPVRAVPKSSGSSKGKRGAGKKTVGDITKVTTAVREEVNRRSMELMGTDVPVCERCGSPKELSKSHIENASQVGSGGTPLNIMNLCGTHGFVGTCHDWCDNTAKGREWKKGYGEMLLEYYNEGDGKPYIARFVSGSPS